MPRGSTARRYSNCTWAASRSTTRPFMFTMRTAFTESFISPSFVPAFITTQPATVPGIPAAHSNPAREWRMAYPINVGIPPPPSAKRTAPRPSLIPPDPPFGIEDGPRILLDPPQPHQTDHHAADPPIPDEQIRPTQDEQWNLACARLLDHQTDILNISRLNQDIRRPSDLERGVLSQRSLEGRGSPETCHRSPHICLRESRMDPRCCRDTPTSSLHVIMRWGSVGPTIQAPSSKYPPPLM